MDKISLMVVAILSCVAVLLFFLPAPYPLAPITTPLHSSIFCGSANSEQKNVDVLITAMTVVLQAKNGSQVYRTQFKKIVPVHGLRLFVIPPSSECLAWRRQSHSYLSELPPKDCRKEINLGKGFGSLQISASKPTKSLEKVGQMLILDENKVIAAGQVAMYWPKNIP